LAAARLQAAKNGYVLGVQGEIEFWNKRLAVAKQGSDEYKSIVEKLAGLEEQRIKEGKKPQKFAQVQEPTLSTSAIDSITEGMTAEAKEQQKEQVQAQREAIDEQIRLAAEGYREAEQFANDEVRMGQMTSQEKITYLQQAANEELRIDQALIQAKQILDNGDVAKQQQDANRGLQIERVTAQRIAQLMRQSAQETQRVWKEAWDKATADFNNAVAQWAVTGKGFAQSMAQIMSGITENFVRNVLKMAEQYLLGLALQKAGQKSQILADAKTAAANTYAAVSAIPVVGPFLAPVAAAGAFAGVLAFDSFGEGGVVRGGGGMAVPVLAHAGERVLTPSQTQNFETLVNNRSSSSFQLEQSEYRSRSALPRLEGNAARGCEWHERCTPPRAVEVRMSLPVFPSLPGLTWPVLKSSEFATLTQAAPNFFETRIKQAKNPRWHWGMSFDVLRDSTTYTEYRQLQGLVLTLAGQFDDFLYTDPSDHSVGPALISGAPNTAAQLQVVNDGAGNYYSPVQRNFGRPLPRGHH
jgi:hypothetical protein